MESALSGSLDQCSFDQLLVAARAGSKEAIGKLFECCRPYLLRLANDDLPHNLRNKTAPSDVVQETFFRAGQKFADFRGRSDVEFLYWLRRILTNAVGEQRRKFGTDKRNHERDVESEGANSRRLLDLLAESGASPGAEVVARELRDKLHEVLPKLSSDHILVVQLRVYEQLSYQEIATRLNRSEEASRKLFERALDHLRQLMISDNAI